MPTPIAAQVLERPSIDLMLVEVVEACSRFNREDLDRELAPIYDLRNDSRGDP